MEVSIERDESAVIQRLTVRIGRIEVGEVAIHPPTTYHGGRCHAVLRVDRLRPDLYSALLHVGTLAQGHGDSPVVALRDALANGAAGVAAYQQALALLGDHLQRGLEQLGEAHGAEATAPVTAQVPR